MWLAIRVSNTVPIFIFVQYRLQLSHMSVTLTILHRFILQNVTSISHPRSLLQQLNRPSQFLPIVEIQDTHTAFPTHTPFVDISFGMEM